MGGRGTAFPQRNWVDQQHSPMLPGHADRGRWGMPCPYSAKGERATWQSEIRGIIVSS